MARFSSPGSVPSNGNRFGFWHYKGAAAPRLIRLYSFSLFIILTIVAAHWRSSYPQPVLGSTSAKDDSLLIVISYIPVAFVRSDDPSGIFLSKAFFSASFAQARASSSLLRCWQPSICGCDRRRGTDVRHVLYGLSSAVLFSVRVTKLPCGRLARRMRFSLPLPQNWHAIIAAERKLMIGIAFSSWSSWYLVR